MIQFSQSKNSHKKTNQHTQSSLANRQTVVVPHAEMFDLKASKTGDNYRIFVSVPENIKTSTHLPVIYVLDANADFINIAEILRRAARRPSATNIYPAIIVGIGYPETNSFDLQRRKTDFTAKIKSSGEQGQSAFVSFIEQDLKPLIRRSYPTNINREVILGHSLAGYFSLNLYARYPSLFNSYVTISPSIWWDKDCIINGLKLQTIDRPAGTKIILMIGQWDQGIAPWQQALGVDPNKSKRKEERCMVDNATQTATVISTSLHDKSDLIFNIFPGEDHASIVPAAMSKIFRELLSSP